MIISGEQLTAPLGWRGERGGERELSLASNGQACYKYIFHMVLKLDDVNRYVDPNLRLLSLPFGNLISRSLC